MKIAHVLLGIVTVAGLTTFEACSTTPKSPDVSGRIHDALKDAGLKDVSVSQDRDKGVVTLKGSVPSDADKLHAESIAKSMAAGQVVGNEIAVLPPGAESAAKTINSDLDAGIKKNLDAALIQHRMHDDVSYEVNNGVVTLTGNVISQADRRAAQDIAAGVPYVQQVVNKIEVKNQRATSTN